MKFLTINNTEITAELSMSYGNGYGQYKIVANCNINGEKKSFSFHSTDSQLWDEQSSDDFDSKDFENRLFAIIDTDLESNLIDFLDNI